MYAAFRDALLRSPVPTWQVEMVKAPHYQRPWYLPPLAPPSKATGKAQLLRLGAMVPGAVRGYEN